MGNGELLHFLLCTSNEVIPAQFEADNSPKANSILCGNFVELFGGSWDNEISQGFIFGLEQIFFVSRSLDTGGKRFTLERKQLMFPYGLYSVSL